MSQGLNKEIVNPTPAVSVILSCYNGGAFLERSIRSVIAQQFLNWELIFVNDGSTDNSLDIAASFQKIDPRISIRSKVNGGLASARLHGLKFISAESKYLIFYDADDMMHPEMLLKLYNTIESDPQAGAAYCNHRLIDINDNDLGLPTFGKRVIPTNFWMKTLDESLPLTPFISIFCWASRMIEPMTLLRRTAYEQSFGWDQYMGGPGNIGEGVLLFSEIALSWKIFYINEPLYFYRKHPNQATAFANKDAGEKVLAIWQERIKSNYIFSKDIQAAIVCYKYRLFAFKKMHSVKHALRYYPLKAIVLIWLIFYNYIKSFKLLLYKRSIIFKYNAA
jgi:glycosyltransferase involved in cell wall biosynthesis